MTSSDGTPATRSFSHAFRAISCDHVVLTTRAATVSPAGETAEAMLAQLDAVASRFRADSEVSTILGQAATEDVTVVLSPLLGSCIDAALRAAELTDGLVDPTVGAAVIASGYDVDIEQVRSRARTDDGGRASPPPNAGIPGWSAVRYDPDTRVLSMPRGTVLDLGATAKAHAADLVAERCAQRLPGGFLINFGGDIAVSGPPPDGGWDVGVEDANGDVCQVVVSTGQAIATSSTSRRSWMGSGGRRHHIIDPRTGESAEVVWTQVTCAGVTALEANAASTAGVILGERAPQWLTDRGVPARLERAAGQVVVTPGWPDPEERAA